MRKYIFTLGIILTTIIMPVYAYRSRNATSIWTDSSHNTPAKEICSDNCAAGSCWLPDGIYYDNKGTFTETCTNSLLSCPSGQYDIGFGSCIRADTNGITYGFYEIDGATSSSMGTYSLTERGTWGLTLYTGNNIKGIASCNGTSGTLGGTVDTEFSQSSSSGGYCWCKMMEPAVSRWVFIYYYAGRESFCPADCADACGYYVQMDSAVRSGMFRSVSFDQTSARGLADCSVSCSDGYYFNGSSCVYCDPASFAGIDTQTETISHGSRSRSKSCTSVNTSGGTACACAAYSSYGNWAYSCNRGYAQSGDACVCLYDIGFSSCIDASPHGDDHGYRNDSTGAEGANSSNTTAYGLTTNQTWGVTFSGYGNVTGIASCNSTKGTPNVATTANFSQSDKGQCCWCKMTSPAASRWVSSGCFTNADKCAYYCAFGCAYDVHYESDFRSGVFGSVGN